ncbi:MAG: Type secretion system secretin RcpA/CpaC, associated with Flp pilus assembly [Hyphomicrobiales bacterium]|nr:Type secretion system secretin RcpA/CpaC, associated with Flp pilus assembly [Hyphomicrobiales bacterium]
MNAYTRCPSPRVSSALRLLFCVLVLILVAPFATSQAVFAADRGRVVRLSPEASQNLIVAIGATETFRTGAAFVDLVVGDPDIADVMPLTDQSFYIHGRRLGTTTISAYNAEKSLIGSIEVEVSYNTNRLQAELRKRLPGSRIEVSSINGRIVLSGAVSDGVTIEKAMEFARQFGNEVVNSMTVSQPQQVMLEVRFLEVTRNAGRDLGVTWEIGTPNSKFGAATGLGGAAGSSIPFGTVLGKILTRGGNADVIIDALEQKGLARRLAEPNLVAMSGQSASFLAGGEFPFPVQAEQGRVTVAFKKFGVSVNFLPTVLADGVINLKIEPEVSQLDQTNVVSTGGINVPALIVRRANTQVELRDGQSFAIAGLLQATSSDALKQLPWIGDVPIIGTLFRSASFEKRETELVMIVTPRLVQPAPPGTRLKTPFDDNLPANDPDRFLLGKHETPKTSKTVSIKPGPGGHVLEMKEGGRRAIVSK